MVLKEHRVDTKDKKSISYRFLRNMVVICGYGTGNLFEKPYAKLYIVYLLVLMICFVGNAVYAINVHSAGENSVPTLPSILSITMQYIFFLSTSLWLSRNVDNSRYTTTLTVPDLDVKIAWTPSNKDHTASIAVIAIIFTFHFLRDLQWVINTCLYGDETRHIVHVFFFMLINFVCDFVQVVNVMIVEVRWVRARFTRQILEKKIMEDVRQSVKIEMIKKVMEYNKNVECLIEPLENMANLKVLVSLLFTFTYTIVILTNYADVNVPAVSFVLQICYIVLLPCASSVVYELLASELDKMKAMIVKEYAFSTDERNRRMLSDVLLAWRIRNYPRALWRVIPLDVTLLFNFISLVTTYCIVVAQFKKLI